jgi:decaprenyl-phosphate phosphoribosyltransferase
MYLKNILDVFRPKRWYRNLMMIIGTVIAIKVLNEGSHIYSVHHIAIFIVAFVSLCLTASGNYGINEILDAKSDAKHPQKKHRAIPAGRISVKTVLIISIVLYILGLALIAFTGNIPLIISVLLLCISGIVYNVPPIRLKDKAYVDFTTEALNNVIRLMIGWYVVAKPGQIVPASFLFAYWFIGIFLMAAKRFGEIRLIGNKAKAAQYRLSLQHYDEEHLLMAMVGAVSAFSFMLGVLSLKYSVDVVIVLPFIIAWIIWFFKLSFEENTIVKDPERIFEKKGFLMYSLFVGVLFAFCFFTGNKYLNFLR